MGDRVVKAELFCEEDNAKGREDELEDDQDKDDIMQTESFVAAIMFPSCVDHHTVSDELLSAEGWIYVSSHQDQVHKRQDQVRPVAACCSLPVLG